MEKEKLILRDHLAIERTHLANERTFLAYFRSAFVFLATGITLLKVEIFSSLYYLGFVFTLLFPLTLLIGSLRYYKMKKLIRSHYE